MLHIAKFVKSPDPLFRCNKERLFHPINIRQLYKILCQRMHPLNFFIEMKKERRDFI